ncbi:anti-sigma factor [Mesobacterium sp. TK19101]|uniref:Regulator of SigK n=1 Tax=Mesobacterium hydrothermale TaxID=3111907 RepID=A0ABU6HJ82_9RHOB|nr:anti-sigma factor [Mesobacterium sp. TK19101]MEC3861924.1 anti-sigma factor [Mesobacterium sp. TK19101]
MTGPDETLPGGPEAEAAEYALGLLTPAERARFEARLATDPALRAVVADWQTRFATLADDLPEVAPPPRVQQAIEAQLFGQRRPLWRQLLPYLAGGVVAAGIAWGVMITGVLEPADPHLYADLDARDSGYVLLAHWAPDSGTFMLRRDEGGFPQDSSIEIWVIPPGAAAPISVGLMQAAGLTQIPVPDALVPAMTPGTTVALSLEPQGGSPTGAPTGPILATGLLGVRS